MCVDNQNLQKLAFCDAYKDCNECRDANENDGCVKMEQKIKKLEEENKKLRECVEFYSHRKNRKEWKHRSNPGTHNYDIACSACNENNPGELARDCLKELSSNGS